MSIKKIVDSSWRIGTSVALAVGGAAIYIENVLASDMGARGYTLAVHKSLYRSPVSGEFDNPREGTYGHVNPDGTVNGLYNLPAARNTWVCNELIDKDSCDPVTNFVKEGVQLYYPIDTGN